MKSDYEFIRWYLTVLLTNRKFCPILGPTDPLFSDDTASPIVSEGSVIQGHTQVYLGQSLQIYQKTEVL